MVARNRFAQELSVCHTQVSFFFGGWRLTFCGFVITERQPEKHMGTLEGTPRVVAWHQRAQESKASARQDQICGYWRFPFLSFHAAWSAKAAVKHSSHWATYAVLPTIARQIMPVLRLRATLLN